MRRRFGNCGIVCIEVIKMWGDSSTYSGNLSVQTVEWLVTNSSLSAQRNRTFELAIQLIFQAKKCHEIENGKIQIIFVEVISNEKPISYSIAAVRSASHSKRESFVRLLAKMEWNVECWLAIAEVCVCVCAEADGCWQWPHDTLTVRVPCSVRSHSNCH